MARRKKPDLDDLIEQAYGRLAQGKGISVTDIVPFYRDARAAVAAGQTVDEAVAAGVAKYCT